LFVLIVYAHPYWFDLAEPYLLACAQRGCQIVALRQPLSMRKTTQTRLPFTTRSLHDAIDVSIQSSLKARRCTSRPYH
jgi:hypothetical protein